MNPVLRKIASVLAVCIFATGCTKKNENVFQGWVEADLIFVSPDEQGRVVDLRVREGDRVEKGAPLITLDDDLQKADVGMAEATLMNTRQAFDRAQQLARSGSGTQRDFDVAQANFREAEARFKSQLTRLARRRLDSPVGGSVQQVYFRPGETVQPGKPIVAILPPENVKLRFFVPEPILATVAIDSPVAVSCDNCPADLRAKVTFISRSAEFTPPVIYSLEERSKLVFMVEARPEKPDALRVGQPVSVNFMPRETAR